MAPSLPSSLTGCREDDKHKCEGWAFGTKKFTGCWIMSCWRDRELENKHLTKSSIICAIDDEVTDLHCLEFDFGDFPSCSSVGKHVYCYQVDNINSIQSEIVFRTKLFQLFQRELSFWRLCQIPSTQN